MPGTASIMRNFKQFNQGLTENDVTSETAFLKRRQLIKTFSAGITASAISSGTQAGIFDRLFGNTDDKSTAEESSSEALTSEVKESEKDTLLDFKKNTQWDSQEPLTSEYSATHYNNFYEFGLGKGDPAKNAQRFITDPWKVQIAGLCDKPGNYDLNDVLKGIQQEERIYRLRCVEAWSMVVPWVGVPMADLLKKFAPKSSAKFIKLYTLYDPEQMPGQRRGRLGFSSLNYPYVEGLRMDEAMNPLTMMATGVYGKKLPPQNGAPFRLIVPWKYGFKSIKSVVKIEFLSEEPLSTWTESAPREYGFYANVNPSVDHPRWTQAKERRIIDESLFSVKRIATRMFNGYEEQVADMYKGMNLKKHF